MIIFAHIWKSKFASDLFVLMNGRILTIVVAFVVSVITTRELGPDNKGILASVLAVITVLFPLGELGVRQSMLYFAGQSLLDDDSLLKTIGLFNVMTITVITLLCLLTYLATDQLKNYGIAPITLALTSLIPYYIITNYSGFLMGKGQIRVVARGEIYQQLCYLTFMLVLVIIIHANVVGVLLADLLAAIVNMIYVIKRTQLFGKLRISYVPGVPLRILKLGFVYAIALFILSLNYRADVLMLGKLSNTFQVGVYSVGVGIAEMLWVLPMAIAQVNLAHSAMSNNHRQHIFKTLRLLRYVLFIGFFVCLILYLASPMLIKVVYGERFEQSANVIQMLIIGIWFSLIFRVLNSDLAGRGRPRYALYVYSFALLINIIINWFLIPQYGSIGAALASTISYTVGALIFAVVYVRVSDIQLIDLLLVRHDKHKEIVHDNT